MGRILVTGASRGIGSHLSRSLALRGHTVFAGMRNVEAHQELDSSQGNLRPVALDVSEAAQIRDAVQRIDSECGGIDVLINNAGVAWFSPAEEMSETVLRSTLETNFFGAVRCTQEVLPIMRRQGEGRVIMMSSLAARAGLPLESAYCASKSALEAFSESLRLEVGRFGIHVSVIEPGVTEGGLSISIADPEAPEESVYSGLIRHTFDFYDADQESLESPNLVVDAVDKILDEKPPRFRYVLGERAALFSALDAVPEDERFVMLQEGLGIGWWAEKKS